MKTFAFSATALDPTALARTLADPAAGGFASFEGWVRNHNEGVAVTALEYEAFEALALKEGERIIAQAQARFPITRAACVHRLGALRIGELAVWVGVSAPHRDEAFRACRFIIDEVKHRVPIWKKEHYVNGDSGWVNCERCATHGHERDEEHAVRAVDYSRQTALKEVGTAGQEKLRSSRVLVIGAGGLGVPALSYLAGAGVGTLTVVDADRLEASNLHRQPLYALEDVGGPKADLAASRLRALNPAVTVHAHCVRFSAANAATLLADHDLAIDCSDNFASKFLLSDACVLARKPAIFASVYQYEGQLQVYRPEDPASSCLRCLWPDATQDGIVGNCAQAGVLGPVPGILGSLQSLEALKLLLDLPGQLRGEVLVLDLTTLAIRRLRAPRHEPCRSGQCVRVVRLEQPVEADLEVSFPSVDSAERAGYRVIDIREDSEMRAEPVASARHVPMGELLSHPDRLAADERYLLLCARGARSRAAAATLRAQGYARIYSLRGGAAALR
jgi:molybdopterin/thiamine biosynthesis adenylyltransferase/molybdopterin synthase catalytic subunit/rhodanese-related sulfurtransferase